VYNLVCGFFKGTATAVGSFLGLNCAAVLTTKQSKLNPENVKQKIATHRNQAEIRSEVIQMDGRTDGGSDGWMDGRREGGTEGAMDVWIDGRREGGNDGWMD
jgi:hypothetical protein